MKEKRDIDINSEKQNLYKLLFENHPIPQIVFRRDTLKIISVNNAAAKYYGFSSNELLKLTILDIRPEEEKNKFLEYYKSLEFNNSNAGVWKHKKKDGTVVYVDVTASDIEFNSVPARIISLIDVTKTVESQEALKEEETKYQTLVESVSEGIVLADNDDVIKFVNKRYCEMLGYSKEELIGKVGYEVLLDKDMQELIKGKNLDREKGITDRYNIRMKKKDGSPIFLEISGAPVYDKTGNVIGSLGIHSDVTERQKALEAIKESEEKFRSLVENSIVGVYLIQDGIFKYLNPRLAEIFSYRVEELLYKLGPKDVTPSEDWRIVSENLRKRINGEMNSLHYTFRGKKKDGKINYVEVFGSRTTYEGKPAVIGTLLDITSRKEAEKSLREKEENYSNLINSLSDAIYVLNGKRLVLVNPAWEKLFGITAAEATSNDFDIMQIVAEESVLFINEKFKLYQQSKSFSASRYEMKGKTRNKGIRELEVSVSKIVWQGEIAAQGIYRDITDQKEAENILRLSEEKYRNLFELAPVGIYQTTIDGKIVTANKTFAKILGFDSVVELMEHNISEFYVDQEVRDKLIEKFRPKGQTANVEIEWKRKDGQKIWIQLDAHVMGNGTIDEPDFEGFVRDISDRKKAEMAIVAEKEKAEEANRLKTGFLSTVSHEIRSPLNAILGFSSILKEAYYNKASEEEKDFFESMEEAGLRLLDTITQVLDISRLEADDFSLNLKPISVNQSVKSAYQVLHLQAKNKNLNFDLHLPEKEIILNTDEYCFGGVLVNLISNAIKYSNKGTISVNLSETKDYVVCAVKDEGVGMSEDYQKHLFETFSQEDLGLSRRYEGTGLGLAITKRYLDLLGGNIEVHSKKEVGTTMIFSIPKSI
jgi:PAS domain S-box-containing protein